MKVRIPVELNICKNSDEYLAIHILQPSLTSPVYISNNKHLPRKLPSKIEKRFLKIVVTLSRYFIILQILLPMKSNLLGFHLSVLDINLVTTKNNGNIFTDPDKRKLKRQI
jgi:hypothetical protein